MVSKMNRVTFIQLLFYFCLDLAIGCMLCYICYYAFIIKKYFICSICFLSLTIMCTLMFKICLSPFWKHFKPIKFKDMDIISANISKMESKVILADRGADVYRIIAYYSKNNNTYIFKDEFYYNDKKFAKRIKMIIENEELPQIHIMVEKNNINKYKIKSCEYIVDLSRNFPLIY